MQSKIGENYLSIKNAIPKDVLLLAVSKTRSVDEIKDAVKAGCMDFGENKAQELIKKYEVLPDLNWHFIGRLQKNKVRLIVGKVKLIHSVDSLDLALEINKRAAALDLIQNILLEVNVAHETQKGGINPLQLEELLLSITSSCPNVKVCGLMTVAPASDNPENVRVYFKELKSLLDRYSLDILSMGMSGDYKIAIEEGSNCIRVGTSIFGIRNYSKEENL